MREMPGDDEEVEAFEVQTPVGLGEPANGGGSMLSSMFGRRSNLREAALVAQVAKADGDNESQG
jgi:hypothetical protein